MYNPANQTTDSRGNPYSLYCADELSTSGLAGVIKTAKNISVKYTNIKIIDILNAKNNESAKLKFSLVVRELMKDLNLDPYAVIQYGSSEGFRCVRFEGTEYREKKNSIIVI